jgi:VWFA-related protein
LFRSGSIVVRGLRYFGADVGFAPSLQAANVRKFGVAVEAAPVSGLDGGCGGAGAGAGGLSQSDAGLFAVAGCVLATWLRAYNVTIPIAATRLPAIRNTTTFIAATRRLPSHLETSTYIRTSTSAQTTKSSGIHTKVDISTPSGRSIAAFRWSRKRQSRNSRRCNHFHGWPILDPKGPPRIMICRILALVLAIASLVPSSAFAQAKPTDVYVSVLDNKGQPVEGLGITDFTVREDNVAREVLKVAPATEPLTIALLVDDSQAAHEGIQQIRDGVKSFITNLADKGDIALITFGERPTIVVDYTKDQKRLLDAAGRLFPRTGGGSYLLEALVEVSKGLQKREAKRPVIAVLMLEDVEFSNRYYQQVLTELDKSGAALHVLAIGQPSGDTSDEVRNRNMVIAEGTERTGGRRDQLLAISATPEKMKQLAAELSKQYVVTYARPETLIPPEKVTVTVTRPGLTARARTRAAANK